MGSWSEVEVGEVIPFPKRAFRLGQRRVGIGAGRDAVVGLSTLCRPKEHDARGFQPIAPKASGWEFTLLEYQKQVFPIEGIISCIIE